MAPRYCAECGHQITEGTAFCANCGKPIQPPTAAAAPSPAPPAPPPQRVVVEKNSHPILTFIGGAVVLLVVMAILGNLRNKSAASAGPAARFIVTDVLSDENCTTVGDYCLRVHCLYQNTGDAAGERHVRAQLVNQAGEVVADHANTLTLLPGATNRVTFTFPEATLEVKTVARCGVDRQ